MDKTLLLNLIEREQNYFDSQESGSEEYVNSQARLMKLNSQLTELEKAESEKEASAKDQKNTLIRNVLEGVKVGSGIVLPIIGLVAITAVEKDTTFTGSLREYTRYFLPKKNWKTDPKTRGYGNIASCFSHKKHIPL